MKPSFDTSNIAQKMNKERSRKNIGISRIEKINLASRQVN